MHNASAFFLVGKPITFIVIARGINLFKKNSFINSILIKLIIHKFKYINQFTKNYLKITKNVKLHELHKTS